MAWWLDGLNSLKYGQECDLDFMDGPYVIKVYSRKNGKILLRFSKCKYDESANEKLIVLYEKEIEFAYMYKLIHEAAVATLGQIKDLKLKNGYEIEQLRKAVLRNQE